VPDQRLLKEAVKLSVERRELFKPGNLIFEFALLSLDGMTAALRPVLNISLDLISLSL
jgi:hypothetical protein